MNKIKLMIKKQRDLLEKKIENSDTLLDPSIIIESKKLDLILNKYMKKSINYDIKYSKK
ncbi:MAG: Spo0E family sporulation regulatory protein-aspartic acid phosphatase [Clostridium tyrobutyricum]|jgi:hypothetical protein|uniref:Spo0E family sporulation regulatory protein-aspartic acid phosphatase n=1 Tax=Clostridium tyrobutyricum TaxID=1519 RepID=UPI002431E9B0|nr:Spo0E family sporulation regulatory protein-aspartic acid phosphatase [Clostridium tyrobutyricum]MCH4200547.1 Spo0E family sporulation regulatory protein-aspartic acid phosphatase [Clostridium tyrobutyricum]MCH4237605.1 Spo0E family sporulation regulatory protein-aspartic acid phosphatase [Clostridium tyrobutyricum]MCH4259684.1 Spo0E family sporulation regulatory protein-aspartic acid phosphatase [Clostridium tyrobutyricum]